MRSRISGVMRNIFSGCDVEAGVTHDGQKIRAQFFYRQSTNVLGIEPHSFRIKRFLRSRSRLFEVHHGVRAIDAFERERFQ